MQAWLPCSGSVVQQIQYLAHSPSSATIETTHVVLYFYSADYRRMLPADTLKAPT